MTIYVSVGKKLTDSYDLSSTQFELSGDTTVQIPSGVFQTDGDYLPGGNQTITYAANVTIDFSLGATAYISLTGNINITLDNSKMLSGGVYRLRLNQGGAGGFVVSSWSITSSTLKWSDATAPVLTTTAGRIDIITFVKGDSVVYGAATLNFG